MSIWVDAYVVESENGTYFELFGDHTMAEDYVETINSSVRAESPKLVLRHTIVDIED